MRAIISDIHANLEALETVLKDIQSRDVAEIICLGDLIGYGPNPVECLDRIMGYRIVILGNHDEAVFKNAVGFTEMAREAVEWTRKTIRPNWLSPHEKKKRWHFIENLPLTHNEDHILYVHGSPRNPTTEYILRSDTDTAWPAHKTKLDEIFSMIPQVCFVGHTHEPGIITQDYKFLAPEDINNSYEIKEDQKIIVNTGSVGQPRDGDNRACYITFDKEKINYHRIAYPYQTTQEKIYKVPELMRRSGERLAEGK